MAESQAIARIVFQTPQMVLLIVVNDRAEDSLKKLPLVL